MKRREFIAALGGAAAMPLAAHAQPGERVRRIGWLITLSQDHPEGQTRIAAFREGLAAAGWTEGRNLHIDYRWEGGALGDRLRASAAELLKLRPDAIMVGGSRPLIAVLEQSQTVPTVFVATAGNVEHGIVTNVARPSGNATGFTLFYDFALAGKLLGTLNEIAPGLARVAIIMNRDHPSLNGYNRSLKAAAVKLGVSATPPDRGQQLRRNRARD